MASWRIASARASKNAAAKLSRKICSTLSLCQGLPSQAPVPLAQGVPGCPEFVIPQRQRTLLVRTYLILVYDHFLWARLLLVGEWGQELPPFYAHHTYT